MSIIDQRDPVVVILDVLVACAFGAMALHLPAVMLIGAALNALGLSP